MFISILLFTASTIFLYLSSKALLSHIIKFFLRLTHSQSTALNLFFFLLLPGIFLHEFAHILSAEILRVPTGHLSLKPQLQDNKLKLGSAQISSADPFRLTLIGTAPFILGTFTLWSLLYFGLNLNPATLSPTNFITQFFQSFSQTPIILLFIVYYLLFTISNTMFSSVSDLQAAGLPIIFILIVFGIFKLTNLNLPISIISYFSNFLLLISTIFFLTFFLYLILLFPLKFINKKI